MRIERGELDLGVPMGSGAQGALFAVRKPERYGFSFGGLIYKEFAEHTTVAGAALEGLASLRDRLDDHERAVIDAMTVWPCAVVVERGRVCGYLMQAIPDWFRQPIRTMASGHETIPREVQHLFVAAEITRKNFGEAPDAVERLALARGMAFVLGFLHAKGLVFGDVSYRNEVYALRPRPAIMLLDCDSIRVRGQGSAVPQLNSPGWAAPEAGAQTIETDRYKLGLFVLRCLTPGVNAQNRDPEKAVAVLDRAGMGLLRRAVGDDPTARPSGKDWVDYLDPVITRNGGVKERHGWVPAPAAPPTRAKVRVGAAPGTGAFVVAGAGLRRAAPVTTAGPRRARQAHQAKRPLPGAPGGPGRRVHPSQVSTAQPSAWSWIAPNAAASSPGRLAAQFVIIGAVIVGFLVMAAIGNRGSGRFTTSTTRYRPTTTLTPNTSPSLPTGLDTALRSATAQAADASNPVAVTARGSFTTATSSTSTAAEGQPYVDSYSVTLAPSYAVAGRPVALRTYASDAGSATWTAGPAEFIDKPGAAELTGLPMGTGSIALRVLELARPGIESAGGRAFGLRWRCDPAGLDIRDCVWQVDSRGAGPPDQFVAWDGSALVDRPAWIDGADSRATSTTVEPPR